MTSRDRVRATLARAEPDRVPINYSANGGIDRRLKELLGLSPEDSSGLRQRLGVDFEGVSAPYLGPRLHPEVPDRHVDAQWGIHTRWVEHGSGGYWDFCDFPLKNASEETFAAWPMPNPDHFDYGAVREACRQNQQHAVFVGGAGLGDIMNGTGFLCGTEQILMGLVCDDPALLAFIDRRLGVQLEVTRRELEAAEGRVDFVWIGEDLGSQTAPLIGLDLYRRHLRPRHQRFVDLANSFGVPVMVHSCGSSSWAYPDFIEMGIAAVDTLQPEAAHMSPAYLKKEFGDRLAFHGCISTAGALSFGTVENVRREVEQTLACMMPGGGYCLSPTHAIQDNSPAENVLAMYDTALARGKYN